MTLWMAITPYSISMYETPILASSLSRAFPANGAMSFQLSYYQY